MDQKRAGDRDRKVEKKRVHGRDQANAVDYDPKVKPLDDSRKEKV